MSPEQLIHISSTLLVVAFFIYFAAAFSFVISVIGKNWSNRDANTHKKQWGTLGVTVTLVGFAFQMVSYIMRWMGQGHAPVSNMFEFMSFLAMMTALGFIILYYIYRTAALGAFVLPMVVTLIGWASVFDSDPKPLIPALQSYWLKIHVSMAALSEGIFAVGFAAGLMYIIRTVNQKVASGKTFALECFLSTILMLIGFIILTSAFRGVDYQTSFEYINERNESQVIMYTLPAIAKPYDGKQLTEDRMKPLISTPSWMKGKDAPRKFNTVVWSFLSGMFLYGLLRLILRKRLGAVMQPWLDDLKPSMLDEISYRAIAIAFPIFTLGALIFAMIWAEKAWGRFWGWDPKEVWALITFLFYSVYLHLRLSKGWHGEKSAWLAVIGFIIIMFNLVFVNLIIAGLHSYAS
ncbi:cytochrome c biogenesis protein CcsA [Caldalkalibacillus mannanilyticus]|uniref:cytochrome c biogenesis protein CcsA n=1 Tax=Caldalkalibacillus mannanilyticus TaxID=1418 RepID=UPI000550032B|nr:cytochrome c biogenesis protein CcsA [Caldalkalibacillus mannanilyticus]